jgi:hypothetical protein
MRLKKLSPGSAARKPGKSYFLKRAAKKLQLFAAKSHNCRASLLDVRSALARHSSALA